MKKKETLILHYGLLDDFEYMTKEQIADLVIAIFRYEIYGEKPEFNDRLLYPYFQNVARVLDSNKVKYVEKCEKNRENIKKRWANEKGKQVNSKTNEKNSCIRPYSEINDGSFSYAENTDKDNDKDNENDNDNVYVKDNDENYLTENITTDKHTHKKQYGLFSNVLLNDGEYEQLKVLHPTDYQQRIDSISSYMKAQGKTYKDDFARLCSWRLLDKEEEKPKKIKDDTPSYDIDAYMQQSLDLTYIKTEGTS